MKIRVENKEKQSARWEAKKKKKKDIKGENKTAQRNESLKEKWEIQTRTTDEQKTKGE